MTVLHLKQLRFHEVATAVTPHPLMLTHWILEKKKV